MQMRVYTYITARQCYVALKLILIAVYQAGQHVYLNYITDEKPMWLISQQTHKAALRWAIVNM